jgi:nitrous oxidase accessory protein
MFSEKCNLVPMILKAIPILFLLIMTFTASPAAAGAAASLQVLIEQTPEGETVALEPGRYTGLVIIEKAVILDGKGQVTIDGLGKGSVLLLKADGVVIKNMIITNSGDSHDRVDAGILVRSSRNRILNNKIENTLFGIDLQEAHENTIIGNEISSKNVTLGLRGDGIRVWASHRNTFRHNRIHDSRDMVIWYSNDNIIEENEGWNNRYSLHFMFAGGNMVRRNTYHHNTVGIFLMYSRDATVEHNVVKYSLGGTGVGIGLKEVDNMTIRNNKIVYCTAGLYFDLSPFQPDRYNFLKANIIAYNVVGADFNSTLSRNILKGNAFIDNLETVRVRGNGVASENLWEGNYYSDYEGFDRDKDGYGDFVYNHDIYLDTLWMNNDWMRLFSGSPVISVINLLAKLAPISEPRRLLTDRKPVFSPSASVLFSEANLRYDPPLINLEADDEEDGEMPARFASSGDDDEDDDEEEKEIEEALKKKANYNRYFLEQ